MNERTSTFLCLHPQAESKTASEEMRVSYAMPLEIIWLTPLNTWNPYNIALHGDDNNFPTTNTNTGVNRNGRVNDTELAYNGE